MVSRKEGVRFRDDAAFDFGEVLEGETRGGGSVVAKVLRIRTAVNEVVKVVVKVVMEEEEEEGRGL